MQEITTFATIDTLDLDHVTGGKGGSWWGTVLSGIGDLLGGGTTVNAPITVGNGNNVTAGSNNSIINGNGNRLQAAPPSDK